MSVLDVVTDTAGDIANKVDDAWKNDSNTILTIGSVLLTAGSIVLACVGQHKADEKIANMEATEGRKLTFWEKVKGCWYYYIPATVAGTGASICSIESNNIALSKIEKTAAIATVAERTVELTKKENESLREKLSQKKQTEAESKTAREVMKERNVLERSEFIKGNGDLFYDPWLDRIFRADPIRVDKTLFEYREQLGPWNSLTRKGGQDWMSFNSFWEDAADLDSAESMIDYGWSPMEPIEFIRESEYLDPETKLYLCHYIYWRGLPVRNDGIHD